MIVAGWRVILCKWAGVGDQVPRGRCLEVLIPSDGEAWLRLVWGRTPILAPPYAHESVRAAWRGGITQAIVRLQPTKTVPTSRVNEAS